MFLRSRFIVVDDKDHHLTGIKNTLDALRLDCHTKLYSDDGVAEWGKLPGTRILFMDQNLTTGATFGSGNQVAYAAIADVIQKVICPDSGPYGIVLWAEKPELEELREFLFGRLTEDDARLLPVFMAELCKGEYIDTETGDVRDPEKLREDLSERISSSPQMRALFAWESDVFAAVDAVLRSLVNLVPIESRASEAFSQELGKVMYRLSQAGAGTDRALENPRESVNRVLVPILADRITEHDPEGVSGDAWREAIVELDEANKNAPVPEQAAVNTAIHLSFARGENSAPIKPTDLGAVLDFPFNDVDEALSEHFGISKEVIEADRFFGLGVDDWQRSKLKLIQIGPACDHAQPKDGSLLFLLGLEWQYQNSDGTRANNARLYQRKTRKNDQEWRSPTLLVGPERVPGKLSAFLNCTISKTREGTVDWETSYRLRDELISKLTQEYARHISRPGIVTLGPDG